jgi:hypothetical protein
MSNASTTQHTQLGHNVVAAEGAVVSVGDLTITSLSSNDLITYTRQLLRFITHRDWKAAGIYLASLKAVSSLDDECKTLLELLEYKLNVSQANNAEVNQDQFLDLLRSQRSSVIIKDVVESIYIHYLSLISESKARVRYENSVYKNRYADEQFYERIANITELNQRIEIGLSDLFESELCSLVRCAIRCEDFQLAIELSKKLVVQYSNINSDIVLSLSVAYRLNEEIDGRHHWLISRKNMSDLKANIDNCLALVKKTSDSRVAQLAGILLAATCFQSTELIDICIDNIEEVEKTIPLLREFLPTETEGGDLSTVKGLLNKGDITLSENEFVQISSALFHGAITANQVRKWLKKGWSVSVLDEYVNEFIEISLSAIVCEPNDIDGKSKLSLMLEQYLEKYREKLILLNILSVYQLCNSLRRIGLHLYSVQLLEPRLPDEPWPSPALNIYAEALLMSDQMGKLDTLLEKMDGADEGSHLLAVMIESECLSNSFDKAIELIEIALIKYRSSSYYWALLLRTLYQSNSAQTDTEAAVARIPKEILQEYSDEGLNLIHLIAKSNLNLAEYFILEWFIENPVGMAINVTNLHFNHMERTGSLACSNYPSERCTIAVVYSSENREYTKLLVDDCGPSEHCIDTNSAIGQLLSDADTNEVVDGGMISYKVIEKLPPVVGAFRIALNIRESINLGDDCFKRFSIDEGSVEDILKQIDSMSKHKQTIEAEIKGKAIPLLMRLNHSHSNNLVMGAFIYLCDKESNQSFGLFTEGAVVKKSVVLDVLSLVYLSLTGFCEGLIKTRIKIYITRETQGIVSQWLDSMGKDDFLSIAKVDGKFIKTTAEDVAKDEKIKNLRDLLHISELLIPASIDMPEMLIKLKDHLDISHYSSLKASISHSIPFLCLDSHFCNLYRELDVKLVNANQLMVDANFASTENNVLHMECHVYFDLAVPLTYSDIITLCRKKEKGQFLAAEILKKYPNNYVLEETALYVLTNCCLGAIYEAYHGYKGDFYLSEWRYTEHVVYAACKSALLSLKGESPEQRLALLVFQVFKKFKVSSDMIRFSIALFKRFITGYFLDAKIIDLELNNLEKLEMDV